MSGHGRRVAAVCSQCDEIFTRRVVDFGRGKVTFCGRRCHGDALRTGRRRVPVPCNGCGITFMKLPAQVNHRGSTKNFCTQRCYLSQVDRQALGRAGSRAPKKPVPIAARFLRAQRAGIARARNLSPERLREIAMMGVAARVAKNGQRRPYRTADVRDRITVGLEWVGPLLTRQGGASPARGAAGRRPALITADLNPAGAPQPEEEVDA